MSCSLKLFCQPGDDLITRDEDYSGPNQIENIIEQLKQSSGYDDRLAEVQEFNAANRYNDELSLERK